MFYGALAGENHKYLLGTIDFGEEDNKDNKTLEERQLYPTLNLGSVLGSCEVWVYTNEGPVPHFHIINKSKKFESCICLITNKYFSHGSKIDILNNRQLKLLNKYMKSINKEDNNFTNWQYACNLWNKNIIYAIKNEIYLDPRNQPDYSNITEQV